MRARNCVLLLMIVSLLAATGVGASARNMLKQNDISHASRAPIAQPPLASQPLYSNGGHGRHPRGWHFPRWHRPSGFIFRTLPRRVIIKKRKWRPQQARSRHHFVRHTAHRRPQRILPHRSSGVPPAGEHRYEPDEVLVEVSNSTSLAEINALQRRYRLRRLDQYRSLLLGTTLYRLRIPDRRSVASVIRALERDVAVVSAQPNYVFTLQQSSLSSAAGGLAQYALAKLRLPEAQVLAKGNGVRVAIIDSCIDTANPELAGSIVAFFDTLQMPMRPDTHGTAIASLIAGHYKLMGAAPAARILAVCAFDPRAGRENAYGTTFHIHEGLQWAINHRARVINMSFTGPPDPDIHHDLAVAHKKGVVLVAAAGNGGEKSPPLYPGADPNVIAVTATDDGNRLLSQANRGRYIDLAAPGVQVLVAVPGGYEVSSGTSYSAAEVSGIAALMLQRDPRLSPDQLRHTLMETAKDLGPRGRDNQFGAGLVDALGAIMAEEPMTIRAASPKKSKFSSR